MTRRGRISLLVFFAILLLCCSLVFFASFGGVLPSVSHEFLNDFLGASQLKLPNHFSHDTATSSLSDTTLLNTSTSALGRAHPIFSDIYVISLPYRVDRRVGMDRVRQVVGLNWTYFDAVTADSAPVAAIVEQAMKNRTERSENPWYPSEFSWPASLLLPEALNPYEGSTPSAVSVFPSVSHTISSREIWRDSVGSEDLELPPLTCATGNKTSGPPYHRALPSYLLLTPPKIACWYSHALLLQRILENSIDAAERNKTAGGDAFLILEDDIDVERDFNAQVQEIWSLLPSDWDMVFLGHCWSNETYWPALNATLSSGRDSNLTLHPSCAPKCTHAYAISRRGAARLLAHLLFSPFAYSRALDQAYSWLIQIGRLRSYSVVPSIVIQRKVSSSDVDPGGRGVGSEWRERLVNGVF
ncbi:hypothetical protein BDY19DRAFT_996593 [Irpex rosettiformis]|uniref:Uncharacterized protein n=1 Tax=Irpex rosettiformis TaxID=378272 RepID=A0ACB8TUN4_9APHY|nr:hypothetical protein BDY19DRAFT_996593 [Irpex rosettiformis]